MSTEVQRRGVVAVVARQRRLLVIRRARSVVAPGRLCFPGGGIEEGESEAEALVRELGEELGVTVRPRQRLWRSRTPWGIDIAWWEAELNLEAEPDPNPAEVEAVHWYTPQELRAFANLLVSNRHFLDALDAGEFVVEGLCQPGDAGVSG